VPGSLTGAVSLADRLLHRCGFAWGATLTVGPDVSVGCEELGGLKFSASQPVARE
jgi:hypothetical protein